MVHHWHTGFLGGLKSKTAKTELEGQHPERVVERAVKRMLPRTKLGRSQFGKLHVYTGAEHPHDAQKPEVVNFGTLVQKSAEIAQTKGQN